MGNQFLDIHLHNNRLLNQDTLIFVKIYCILFSGYGNLNKLFIEFDGVFWPPNTYFLMAAPGGNADDTMFLVFFNYYPLSQRAILMTFMAGKVANESEDMSDEEIQILGNV